MKNDTEMKQQAICGEVVGGGVISRVEEREKVVSKLKSSLSRLHPGGEYEKGSGEGG